jgi:hypothetical protein
MTVIPISSGSILSRVITFRKNGISPHAYRFYSPRVLGDIAQSRLRHRSRELQASERKQKTFKPALEHFRLSRFGWEHRKAGLEGVCHRKRSRKGLLLSQAVGYVSPRDYNKMRVYFPHMRIRYVKAPVDSNINTTPCRGILPYYIG